MGNGTRFSWRFSGPCQVVFLLVSPVSLTELCSFWYGLKDLFTLHKLVLTVKTDDVTKGRKDLDPHGRLRAVQGRMG